MLVTKFSAFGPALGYLYQARYALWLLLSGDEESDLMVEGLDDIAFEKDGTPTELLQLKHHGNHASLTDSSPDLWGALRIWADHVANRRVDPKHVIFTLVTTATSTEGSICSKLHPDANRDPEIAWLSLTRVAQTSANRSLREAFVCFLSLTREEQKSLVNSLHVLDGSPNIQDVASNIKDKIKAAVARNHRDLLYERLEGWWFTKVVAHLAHRGQSRITGFELYDTIAFLAGQFAPDALPIDFLSSEPTSIDAQNDTRLFVRQLRAIAVQNRRIEKAIVDYYRAFEQRSRWAREDLLIGEELEQYESKLIDEWERFSLAVADSYGGRKLHEAEWSEIGRHIYDWTQQTADFRLRPNVTEPYVMRGTYHILADRNPPVVWWHPKFVERLRALLPMEETA